MVASSRQAFRLLDSEYTDADGPFLNADHRRHANVVETLQDIIRIARQSVSTAPNNASPKAYAIRPLPLGRVGEHLTALRYLNQEEPDASPGLGWELDRILQSDQQSISSFDIAGAGDIPCQGGACQSGGTYGTSAMYQIGSRRVCRDCAIKLLDLGGKPGSVQSLELGPYLIRN